MLLDILFYVLFVYLVFNIFRNICLDKEIFMLLFCFCCIEYFLIFFIYVLIILLVSNYIFLLGGI